MYMFAVSVQIICKIWPISSNALYHLYTKLIWFHGVNSNHVVRNSHGEAYENYCRLLCDHLHSATHLPTFRMNVMPTFFFKFVAKTEQFKQAQWYLKFSRRWLWRIDALSSEMWHCVAWPKFNDISHGCATSIFRAAASRFHLLLAAEDADICSSKTYLNFYHTAWRHV
jgi:hypothetical protein